MKIKLFEHRLNEMAQVNAYDNEKSPLPSNKYKVYIYGENSKFKTPHFHIYSTQEGFDLEYNFNGDIWRIKSYGTRKKRDLFSDITKLVKEWLVNKPSKGIFETNKDAVIYNWEINNPI